jgi:hypothetical protein
LIDIASRIQFFVTAKTLSPDFLSLARHSRLPLLDLSDREQVVSHRWSDGLFLIFLVKEIVSGYNL